MRHALLVLALLAAPVAAQPAGKAGAPDISRVQSGTYKVDPNHTQVFWSLDHMGISLLSGGKPVTLQAQFHGAGVNPMTKALSIGFTATGTVKRSDYGLGFAAPAVDDLVTLTINAAFEKTGA